MGENERTEAKRANVPMLAERERGEEGRKSEPFDPTEKDNRFNSPAEN